MPLLEINKMKTFQKKITMNNFTGLYDDNGSPINIGDKLISIYEYEVIVMKDKEDYYGKLVCMSGHSCENIPYALNNGKGYSKVPSINE